MKRSFFQKLKAIIVLVLTLLLVALAPALTYSQPNTASEQLDPDQAPVVLGEQTILVLKTGIGSFSVQERAQIVSERIAKLANDRTFQADFIYVKIQADSTKLMAGEQIILAITPADAQAADLTQQALADKYRQQINAALEEDTGQHFRRKPKAGFLLVAVATMAFIVILLIINRIFPEILATLETWRQVYLTRIGVDEAELHPLNRVFKLLSIRALKILRLALILVVFFTYALLVLSQFTPTVRLVFLIKQSLRTKLTVIFFHLVDSIPDLLIIALIIFISYTSIKITNYIFRALECGRLSISGFYPEWASLTSKLVSIIIIGLTLALVFPLLPGSESDVFRGVSVFFGALISLGASGTVGNMLAGIQLTYARSFRVGDLVKIGQFKGQLVEQGFLMIRIRTIENQIVTISNSQILSNQTLNYSAAARDHNAPLMLHTTITLGYEVPLQDAHQTLMAAASVTPHILHEPAPFVWQTSLDDFYVSYQLNVYTEDLNLMLMNTIYSELHANILKQCDEAGIEILSPHYAALRDGNESTLSAEHLTSDSTLPGFSISSINREQGSRPQS